MVSRFVIFVIKLEFRSVRMKLIVAIGTRLICKFINEIIAESLYRYLKFRRS